MSWDFKPGMQVVCVDAHDTNECGFRELDRGRIYVIRWCGIYRLDGKDELCIRVEGVYRHLDPRFESWAPDDHEDTPFAARRFRPLRKRETSIEIFCSLLTPSKVKEEV